MRGFVVGLVLGGSLVAGVGAAMGGVEWGQAPMDAKVGTFLYRNGYCHSPSMTPIMQGFPSNRYVCKGKFKPPTD